MRNQSQCPLCTSIVACLSALHAVVASNREQSAGQSQQEFLGYRRSSCWRGKGCCGSRHVRCNRTQIRHGQSDHDISPRRALAKARHPFFAFAERELGSRLGKRHWRHVHRLAQSGAYAFFHRPIVWHVGRRSQQCTARAGRHTSPALPRLQCRWCYLRFCAAQSS